MSIAERKIARDGPLPAHTHGQDTADVKYHITGHPRGSPYSTRNRTRSPRSPCPTPPATAHRAPTHRTSHLALCVVVRPNRPSHVPESAPSRNKAPFEAEKLPLPPAAERTPAPAHAAPPARALRRRRRCPACTASTAGGGTRPNTTAGNRIRRPGRRIPFDTPLKTGHVAVERIDSRPESRGDKGKNPLTPRRSPCTFDVPLTISRRSGAEHAATVGRGCFRPPPLAVREYKERSWPVYAATQEWLVGGSVCW